MTVASATKESPDNSGSSPSRSPKPESKPASETSSGDTSDRGDVDIMTQVLSRSEEYRLLFRLPPDEALVQDFNCALQENILLQVQKTIPFHEITYVHKAKTAGIFPNAIEIVTGVKKHFFGSFLSRDEAYRLIIDGWAQHNSDDRALLDRQELKSEDSQDNGIVIVESIAGSPELADALSSADRVKDANASEENKPLLNGNDDTERSEKFPEHQENEIDECSDYASSRKPLTWKTEDLDAPKIPANFALVIETKFPVCVEDFFTLFISDHASDFLENFHRRCGDKEFQSTPWRQHEQFGHARDLSFLHPVNVYIGAKLGRCQEAQKYRVYKNSHLVIETAQQVSDVPFADYFHVKRIWDVAKNENEEDSCILRVYFHVAFSKWTMFKGKIEQSTRDELREVHGIWINNAHELLKQENAVKQKEIAGQNTDKIQDQEERAGSSSKLEGLAANNLHSTVTPSVAPRVVTLENIGPRIGNAVQENMGSSTSVTSFFRELWATLLSHGKSQSQLLLYLAVAIVAILILMQISIIILLTRAPKVHVVTQVSGLSGYRAEHIEWLEERVGYLREEMLMIESRLERMGHEHAMLKSQLQSLERLKPK